jgi:hypothetical protein
MEEPLKQFNAGKAQKGASQGSTLEFPGHWRMWWVAVAWINPEIFRVLVSFSLVLSFLKG